MLNCKAMLKQRENNNQGGAEQCPEQCPACCSSRAGATESSTRTKHRDSSDLPPSLLLIVTSAILYANTINRLVIVLELS